MPIQLNNDNQGILLLATHFSKPVSGEPTPLTPMEYGRLAVWLDDHGYMPQDLISKLDAVVAEWVDPKGKITTERLTYLLGRSQAMAIALEKWNSAGIWVITRADAGYPERLRQTLHPNAPPVLFGVGNRKLLTAGGLAVVGSRKIDSSDTAFVEQVAKAAANEGLNVVSGGARGAGRDRDDVGPGHRRDGRGRVGR